MVKIILVGIIVALVYS